MFLLRLWLWPWLWLCVPYAGEGEEGSEGGQGRADVAGAAERRPQTGDEIGKMDGDDIPEGGGNVDFPATANLRGESGDHAHEPASRGQDSPAPRRRTSPAQSRKDSKSPIHCALEGQQ
jgi:hypothetical protein